MVINIQMKIGHNQPTSLHFQMQTLKNAMQWRAKNINSSLKQNNYGSIIQTKADAERACTFAEEISTKIVMFIELSQKSHQK